MNINKSILASAVTAVLGITAMTVSTAASAIAIDGKYELRILTTPTATRTTYYGNSETFFVFGNPSIGWNSSFTCNVTPGSNSQGLTDNAATVSVSNDFSGSYGVDGAPGAKGSGIVDSYAGVITFDIVGGSIGNATSFSFDTIFGTVGGEFAHYMASGGLGGISGSIDLSGNMTLSMAGRFGAMDGPAGGVVFPWNIDPTNTLVGFTTGTTPDPGSGDITGNACTGSGGSYACTLVSAGQIGSPSFLAGVTYYEVWNLQLVRIGAADPTTVVPVPAAAWLLGSGLVGLVGAARRRKQA